MCVCLFVIEWNSRFAPLLIFKMECNFCNSSQANCNCKWSNYKLDGTHFVWLPKIVCCITLIYLKCLQWFPPPHWRLQHYLSPPPNFCHFIWFEWKIMAFSINGTVCTVFDLRNEYITNQHFICKILLELSEKLLVKCQFYGHTSTDGVWHNANECTFQWIRIQLTFI